MKRSLLGGAIGGAAVIIAVAIGITLLAPNEDGSVKIDNPDFEVIEDNENKSEPVGPPTKQDTNEEKSIEERIKEIEEEAEEYEYEPKDRVWQTSGPFQIDRKEYIMGEKVFLRIGALAPNEKGQVAFLRPLNDTHYSVYMTIPFDGQKKSAFNWYFEPRLSKSSGVCSEEDLLGKWAVVFRGTNYENMYFEIVNKTIPGNEDDFYKPVC